MTPPDESVVVDADAIDEYFVPVVVQSVVSDAIGSESILIDTNSGVVHVLDSLAALVWQCFDGSASLKEIIADLADVFQIEKERVQKDVISLVRLAGRAGLLEGVIPNDEVHLDAPGLAEGSIVPLPPWADTGREDRVLLINWSADCGFCESILPQLAALQPGLDRAGTRVVLVDELTPTATRAQVAAHGLDALVISRRVGGTPSSDPFAGSGTPVAYLLDRTNRLLSKQAYGADSVITLASKSARSEHNDAKGASDQEVPRFLPVSGGVCGPGPRLGRGQTFEPAAAYQIGGFRIGIRANAPWVQDVVAGFLGEYRLPSSATAPNNFSVILADGHTKGPKELNVLIAGTPRVARSRSPRRVMQALAGHLSCLIDAPPGLRRLDAIGAVIDGRAMLLPKAAATWHLDRLQGPLAAIGMALVDEPFAHVDLTTGELVVLAPRVQVDGEILERLPDPGQGRSEPRMVLPGRYPVATWLIPHKGDSNSALSPATAVAAALATLVAEPVELPRAVPSFASFVARIDCMPVEGDDPKAVVSILKEAV